VPCLVQLAAVYQFPPSWLACVCVYTTNVIDFQTRLIWLPTLTLVSAGGWLVGCNNCHITLLFNWTRYTCVYMHSAVVDGAVYNQLVPRNVCCNLLY
jgi:hypothetical protein